MSTMHRVMRNLFSGWFELARAFPRATRERIRDAIAADERGHLGEIRVAIESRLSPLRVMRGETARRRAVRVFARLGVWDTEHNSGVLIYLLLAEHAIEIVVDRGALARVAQERWQVICDDLAAALRRGDYEAGTLAAITAVGIELRRHFPSTGDRNANELADMPVRV